MRLLERSGGGKLSLTNDLIDDEVPKYAILSHIWGDPEEEVTFQDFVKGTEKSKIAGYKKIQFCTEQAAHDGFEHCWVDTCCIDKSNHVELSEALNSMFRWYQSAAICYVYMSDISSSNWEQALQNSRWFRRGWTLQELVAPASVEFFSREGKKLGSKESLEPQICEITGIHSRALHGTPLSQFTIVDRLSWTANRRTTYEEDMVYSLLGIFSIHMSPNYGEGRNSAFNRLNEQIEKDLRGPLFAHTSIPFSLSEVSGVECFVAREDELIEMHKALRGNGSRRAVVLHGLGGIGKTQLSIAYAKRFHHSYSAIFWLNAKDEDSLKQSFIKIAKRVLQEHSSASRLSSIDIKENYNEIVDAVKGWLSIAENTRWLMIYDNYDNPKVSGSTNPGVYDIRDYFPESYQGSIIITTRVAEINLGIDRYLPIRKLENEEDSLTILANVSRREGLKYDSDAMQLVKELDGLPLALATAGAYLNQVSISLSKYLHLYKVSWKKLQKTSPRLGTYEDRMLYSTWQISYDRVRQQSELSAKLLQLWAYFDNQDIWFELLCHGDSSDPEWIKELTEDEISFNDAVRVLCNHGLIEADMSSQETFESIGYSMHGCVHSWTIYVLNQEWNPDLAMLALKLIASHTPNNETDRWWITQRRLLQHVARCSDARLADRRTTARNDWAFHKFGSLYKDQGKLNEAETMYLRALQGKEKALGEDHVLTLHTVHSLGLLYREQDKLDNAEKMGKRAMEGYEKALGADHILTLDAVNALGIVYRDLSKLKKAEELYERALQRKEKTLGADHISTLRTVTNLGNLYLDLGKLDEAEKIYERALQGYENLLGADHTQTLDIIHNLGTLYIDQGKLDEAEKMYGRALQGYDKTLGAEHISTLVEVFSLGYLYADQGKLDEAEKMYERALQGYNKALGAEHTSTLNTVNNLGLLYRSQGKLDEAEKMYKSALQGYDKVLGAEHTLTLNTVDNLGTLFVDQGKLDEAEKMYKRALEGYMKVLGAGHASTLNAAKNLDNLYRKTGQASKIQT